MSSVFEQLSNEYGKGNIVYRDIEGFKSIPIKKFIKQPLDGILYDLNRLEEVILTHAPTNEKWTNDFALVKLLRHYHAENEKLRKQIKETK